MKVAWLNTRELPALLRMLIRGGMVSSLVLLVFVTLPLAPWTVNGRTHTYAEMWRSGIAPVAACWLALMAIGCWGVAARKPFCRWILILSPLVSEVSSAVFQPLRLTDIASAGLWVMVAYVSLFHLRSVRAYFGNGHPKAVSGS